MFDQMSGRMFDRMSGRMPAPGRGLEPERQEAEQHARERLEPERRAMDRPKTEWHTKEQPGSLERAQRPQEERGPGPWPHPSRTVPGLWAHRNAWARAARAPP